MGTAIDLAETSLGAQHTFQFVRSLVPPSCSILDAGCGNGLIAKLLLDAGFKVTAIDSKPEAIEHCKQLGIQTVAADFLEYQDANGFDVVLLSRALHHIQPVETALKQAHKLMRSDGLLVVEDFGAELVDKSSAAWFYGLKAVLAADGRTLKSHGPGLVDGQLPQDPLQSWQHHAFDKHAITTSQTMIHAVTESFHTVRLERVPYLYRYFLDDVSMNESIRIFEWEKLLCSAGVFEPVGVRIVAERRS